MARAPGGATTAAGGGADAGGGVWVWPAARPTGGDVCHGVSCTGGIGLFGGGGFRLGDGHPEPDGLLSGQRPGAADYCRGGIPGGKPGSAALRPAPRRGTAAGARLHRRARRGADGPVGQRQRPPGPLRRAAGAGGGAGESGQHSAGAGPKAPDAGPAAVSGGPAGAGASGGARPAAEAAAVPRGRDARGAAADGAHGLDGDRRDPVSGPAGGPVSHGTGKRI